MSAAKDLLFFKINNLNHRETEGWSIQTNRLLLFPFVSVPSVCVLFQSCCCSTHRDVDDSNNSGYGHSNRLVGSPIPNLRALKAVPEMPRPFGH